MVELSSEDRSLIAEHPLTTLSDLSQALQAAERAYEQGLTISSHGAAVDSPVQVCRDAIYGLFSALNKNECILNLRSSVDNRVLISVLADAVTHVKSVDFSYERYRALSQLVIQQAPDPEIWTAVMDLSMAVEPSKPPSTPDRDRTPYTSSISGNFDSSEDRENADAVLNEDVGQIYTGVPGFFETFFTPIPGLEEVVDEVLEKCKHGTSPLYDYNDGWKGWPQDAKETDVLAWLNQVTAQLMAYAEESSFIFDTHHRWLARPQQPLQSSVAKCKLDIGFIDGSVAITEASYQLKQILIPVELRGNVDDDESRAGLGLGSFVKEVFAHQDTRRFALGFTLCGPQLRLWLFDRSGALASTSFDIHIDANQFISVMLGFLHMDETQLGFDPTIVSDGDMKYIEIRRNDQVERLIIDSVISRSKKIAGRATTCWKAYREGDETKAPLVIKDAWQCFKGESEGELLREATEMGVVNVARYYHHETVQINGVDDDIYNVARRNLGVADNGAGSALMSNPHEVQVPPY